MLFRAEENEILTLVEQLEDEFVIGTNILIEGVPNTPKGQQILKGLEQIFIEAYESLRPVGYNAIRAIAKQNMELPRCLDLAKEWLLARNSPAIGAIEGKVGKSLAEFIDEIKLQ